MEDKKGIWKKLLGVCTPGGDPYWECPFCGEDGHLYGVESSKNYHLICKRCGAELKYPWEVKE